MAELTPSVNASVVYRDGAADCTVLVALRNVNDGDTLDIGPTGLNVLQFINRAVIISITSFVEIAASFTGTVVTMPAGLANDAGYLLLWGSSA